MEYFWSLLYLIAFQYVTSYLFVHKYSDFWPGIGYIIYMRVRDEQTKGTQMTPQEKLAKLNGLIDQGKTIYVSNYMHAWAINARTRARFESAGRPVLKADDSHLYISCGKRYDIIDLCKITAA